ncbi:MAG: SusC/RagA family TonB-linked outer membrane protein [Prolixibacteraceae bacterium]
MLKRLTHFTIVYSLLLALSLTGRANTTTSNSNTSWAKETSAVGFKVKGEVTSPNGEKLPGVTVVEKGTSNGTITSIDGFYSIETVSDEAILVFSFVGMKSQQVSINGQNEINIVLKEDAIGLDEVVAIGYGTMKKSDLTGSIVSISTDDLNAIPLPSISDAMQGRAAGVQIISSGTPGSDATIRIRGVGTINDNDPLLVIDGFPTDGGLNQINMNDIASLQILKDASATAIYGSRGANGVVIITTKKGSAKSKVNLDYYYGIQQATNMLEMLNAGEFAALNNDMMENAGKLKNPAFADPTSIGEGTNWVNEMIAPVTMQNVSLSYSGGSDKSTYYVSGNVFDQNGIVLNTSFKRYTIQFNSESKVFDWLTFGNNISLNHDVKSRGDYNIKNTLMALPTQEVYNLDGSYAGPTERPEWSGDIRNPVGSATVVESSTKGYNLRGGIFAEFKLFEGLTFKTSAGLKANIWYDRTWAPKYDWNPTPQEQSYLYQSANKSITWVWDNTLNYNKTFNEIHKVSAMLGTSAQENQFDYMSGSIQNFASDLTQQLSNGIDQVVVNGNASDWSLLSYMARANYSYASKYLLTATIRRDGSSRFGSGNKWGWFPSASLAWRISEENFLADVDQIDDLKLRAGFGVTGNQEIGNYSFASNLSTVKYNFGGNVVNAVVPNVMPNPNVQWESQQQFNIGVDATLLDQRLTITLDAYLKNTKDMLVPMSVPISTGYSDIAVPFINAGEIVNKGIEFTASSRNIDGILKWDTDFNISFNQNKVKSLNDTIPMLRGDVGFNYSIARIETGKPVDIYYGFITEGIFQNQQEVEAHALQVPGNDQYNRTSAGDIRYVDLNSDGVIDDNDRTYLGDPNPDFIFALNNTFRYKGFDLNIFLQGVYGVELFNANRIWNEGMAVAYNQTSETLNRWTGEGSNTTVPRAVFNDPNKNTRPSDRYIEDGSYLRIKNVSLGYNLPANLIARAKMSTVRIYISGTNLLTFTTYKGFDPEVGTSGIDNGNYPITRNISIGANISF